MVKSFNDALETLRCLNPESFSTMRAAATEMYTASGVTEIIERLKYPWSEYLSPARQLGVLWNPIIVNNPKLGDQALGHAERRTAAQQTPLPDPVLIYYATHRDLEIRIAVAKRKNVPYNIQKVLANDAAEFVRRQFIDNVDNFEEVRTLAALSLVSTFG